MATTNQIEANRRNAAQSPGPSAEALARTRFNATRHGLAGQSAGSLAANEAFAERRALWSDLHRPADPQAEFALDQAVAASFRIERCRRALDDLTASASERARLAWDEDRAIEAATIAGRLARDPVLASRQLRASLAGVGLLIESWAGLGAALELGADWSEGERSRALDLLGVAPEARADRTRIDPPAGLDPVAFRQNLVIGEVEHLKRLRERAMVPLDEIERDQMIDGDVALVTKSASLVMRYERDAWRQYREALKVLQAGGREAEAPGLPVAKLPPPLVLAPPPVAGPPRSHDPARKAPVLPQSGPTWLEEMEKRLGPEEMNARRAKVIRDLDKLSAQRPDLAPVPVQAAATERSQFAARQPLTDRDGQPIA